MSDNITQIPTARSISTEDNGYVTANMLAEYMQTFSNTITGGAVTWDVDSINIRCKGKNVLSVNSAGKVTLADSMTPTTELKGNHIDINGGLSTVVGGGVTYLTGGSIQTDATELAIYGGIIDVKGSTRLSLYGFGANFTGVDMYIKGQSNVVLAANGYIDLNANDVNVRSQNHNVNVTNAKTTAQSNVTMHGGFVNLSAKHNMTLDATTKLALHGTVIDIYAAQTVDIGSYNSPISIATRDQLNLTARRIEMRATDIAQYR